LRGGQGERRQDARYDQDIIGGIVLDEHERDRSGKQHHAPPDRGRAPRRGAFDAIKARALA
jgi:hypothetical protein